MQSARADLADIPDDVKRNGRLELGKETLMIQWACTVEAVNDTYTGDVEDLSERIVARIGRHHGSASFGQGRILASFTVDARLVLQATETALKVWSNAMDDGLAWSIVSVSARRADQPDDLPGLTMLLG